MAESDPKKIRPFGQTSDRRNLDSEEDPLVELARIVSEDTGFYGSRAERAKPQREEPIDRNAYSADLESELLQELESSFSARPSAARAAPPPAARPAAATIAPKPVDDSDDLLRSIEKQLGEFERRNQVRSAAAAPAPPPAGPVEQRWDEPAGSFADPLPEDDNIAPDLDDYALPLEPAEDPEPARYQRERVLAEAREREARDREARETREREAREARERRMAEREARERAASEGRERETRERETRDRTLEEARQRIAGVRGADRPDRSAQVGRDRSDARGNRLAPITPDRDEAAEQRGAMRLPLRRRDLPPEEERHAGASGFAASAASGWNEIEREEAAAAPTNGEQAWRAPPADDYRSELRTTFGGLDEGSQAGRAPGARVEHVETEIESNLEPTYSDPSLGTHWEGSPDGERNAYADEPRVTPMAGDAGVRPGRSERGRSRTGLMAAAGVLAIVVIGGAAAMYMRGGEEVPAGPPPVIAAPEGDVKVEAPQAQAAAEGETVGEAVYNRVAGNVPAGKEQVVDGAEEPREISRIVLPPPQENSDDALTRPVGDGTAAPEAPPQPAAAESAVPGQEIGPRRVRTYVVRPDGTIAETQAAPAADASAEAPAAEQQVAAVEQAASEPMVPVRVPTTEIDGTGQPGAIQPDPLQAAAPQAPAPAPEPVETAAVQPAPAIAAPAAATDPAAVAPDAGEAAPVEPLSPPPAQVDTAAAPAASEPAATADGYVVQISSQRSMEDAQSSWSAARSRYPSVLGNMEPNIQQADLGAKGIYYRVRVGPWASRGEAVQVCESLRAAGGDCIVTR